MILNNSITANEVIADITSAIGDEDFMWFSKGWYISRINDAINSLAMDTLYHRQTEDFFEWNDGTCRFDLNSNVINLKEIYLFSKSCSDDVCSSTCGCNQKAFTDVVWKRLHNNTNNFETAKIHKNNRSVLNNREIATGFNSQIVFCNIQNGELMFSSNAENYSVLRLVYDGFPYDAGSVPTVPIQFKEFVSGYVQEKALRSIKNKDKSRRTDWADIHAIVYTGTGSTVSLKLAAERRAKSINTFQRESLKDNFGSFEH